LWCLVAKHFKTRNGKRSNRFQGYITEEDSKDLNFPLRIVYSDGDTEDVDRDGALEIAEESLITIATIGSLLPRKDRGYWVFPAYLAKVYSKLHRAYDLDAMDHVTGKTSIAPFFCSRINSVFNHRLDGSSIWCNPDFSKITQFVKFFLEAFSRDASTALTLVVPVWLTYEFWPLLKSFRLVDYIPTGTHLFRTPDVLGIRNNGEPCDWGPTRWDVAVLYYGAQFQIHRMYKALEKSPLTKDERERITKVVKLNYTLTGVPDSDALRFSTLRVQPLDFIFGGRSVTGAGQQPPLRPSIGLNIRTLEH